MKHQDLGIFQITRLILGAVLFSGILLCACTPDESCGDEVRSQVNFGFYTMSSGIAKDTTPWFEARGIIEGDSVLIKSTNKLTNFSLPMSPNDKELAYVLKFTFPFVRYVNDTTQVIDTILFTPDTVWLNEITIDSIVQIPDTTWVDSAFVRSVNDKTYGWDTLYFNYDTRLKLISPACGFTANYLLHSITSTNYVIAADSIIVPEITTDELENVKIYF